MRIDIKEFGRGRITARNPNQLPLGACRDSLNVLHNEGLDTAFLRNWIDRVWATSPAGGSATLAVHELVKSDDTISLLTKIGTVLYSFALTPATELTSLATGLASGFMSQFATANGLAFIADNAKNYITNGTAAVTHELQKSGPQGTHTLGARTGTAVGNTAATIKYWMTDVEPTTSEETPPSASVSIARLADEGVAITGLTYTGTFTTKRLYRDIAGNTQPYRVITLAASATTHRARAANVATITTAAAHSLQVGQSVTVSGVGGSGYNATANVATTPTTTSFTYSNTGDAEGTTADTGGTVYKAGYLDDTLDSALTTVSTVHDDAGSASIEMPGAFDHICFYRGRLFAANASSARLRWSNLHEPTQWSNASTAYMDIGLWDGSPITGVIAFRGSLVIFKRRSIWIMNGDVDENTFTFAPVVIGIGCIAPRTIAKDGDRAVYFVGENAVYVFDLTSAAPISSSIRPDIDGIATWYSPSGWKLSRAENFCAGINPRERTYRVSVTPIGATTNTETHVFSINSGAWWREQLAMGQIVPSCYSDTSDVGPIHNTNSIVKLYVGDENGYLCEMDTTSDGDGVTGGTKSATITNYVDATGVITCSAAAFRTTGDGLKYLSVTLRRAADGSHETKQITANAATTITAASTWTTDPVVGDTILIGAMEATLSFGQMDFDNVQKKHWKRIEFGFADMDSTTPYRVGYTLGTDTAPTASTSLTTVTNQARVPVHRRAVTMGVYLDVIGVAFGLHVLSLAVEVEQYTAQRPTQ